MSKLNWQKEIDEALVACDKTLIHLNSALKELDSAKNWGLFDMLGGGFITSIVKKGHLHDFEEELKLAKKEAELLTDELDDLGQNMNINLDIGQFLIFTDIFFDNIFSDFLVQDKIDKAYKSIKKVILEIEDIKETLFEAKKLKK